ncbi:hypothetical protein ETD86_23100 [Nonomuraea turkmeniaca]|uniref:Uncharacterized protein n=1 Tax=Nonomuraea turkmeniaca TaxID=103838 RepID=A0A5S4FFI2_9ACTN|nr:hypothetical protein [Nonomuraea turkmeniaca]TMR17516.1 hypothetical protein ETD86_23100 [Nonomuraea turkmeniaca]
MILIRDFMIARSSDLQSDLWSCWDRSWLLDICDHDCGRWHFRFSCSAAITFELQEGASVATERPPSRLAARHGHRAAGRVLIVEPDDPEQYGVRGEGFTIPSHVVLDPRHHSEPTGEGSQARATVVHAARYDLRVVEVTAQHGDSDQAHWCLARRAPLYAAPAPSIAKLFEDLGCTPGVGQEFALRVRRTAVTLG